METNPFCRNVVFSVYGKPNDGKSPRSAVPLSAMHRGQSRLEVSSPCSILGRAEECDVSGIGAYNDQSVSCRWTQIQRLKLGQH
jgi:hypothetical protein